MLIIYWEQLFNGFSSGFFIDPIYSVGLLLLFPTLRKRAAQKSEAANAHSTIHLFVKICQVWSRHKDFRKKLTAVMRPLISARINFRVWAQCHNRFSNSHSFFSWPIRSYSRRRRRLDRSIAAATSNDFSVQPIVYSIFDQDAPAELLLKYPELYEQGREGRLCTGRTFALTMLDAFWQSATIFFVAYLVSKKV